MKEEPLMDMNYERKTKSTKEKDLSIISENTELWIDNETHLEIKEKAKSKLKKIIFICTTFMLIELYGAYYSHSIAILTDAFHLLSDQLGFIISLSSIYISERIS